MPVSSQKKRTTSTPELATPAPSSPILPEQPVFHSAVSCISNATSSMQSPDESALRFRPILWGFGSNRANKRPWSNWRRALAKYGKRYPEAVRSLAEEEEKTLTFYEFPAAIVSFPFVKQGLYRSLA